MNDTNTKIDPTQQHKTVDNLIKRFFSIVLFVSMVFTPFATFAQEAQTSQDFPIYFFTSESDEILAVAPIAENLAVGCVSRVATSTEVENSQQTPPDPTCFLWDMNSSSTTPVTENGAGEGQRIYTGHEYDDDTDLTYANARYYPADTARFLSQDPAFIDVAFRIQDPQSLNSYTYSRNNPLKYVDPTGETYMEAAGGFAVGLVGSAWSSVTGLVLHPVGSVIDLGNFYVEGAVQTQALVGDYLNNPSQVASEIQSGISIGYNQFMDTTSDYEKGKAIGSFTEGAMEIGAALKVSTGFGKSSSAKPKIGSAGGEGAGKTFSKSIQDQARLESGNQCIFCLKPTNQSRQSNPLRSEIDHAIPKSRGGNNTLQNAQNTCRTCNRSKGGQTTAEFIQ